MPSPVPIKIKHEHKNRETRQKNKTHKHRTTVVKSTSENSSSDSEETTPSNTSTDDNIVHQELTKIMDISAQQFKPLVYRFSASRIEKDVRAVAPDKVNFPTADSPPKWECHDDEDAAEAEIPSAATTRSVIIVTEAAAEVPETWKKLRKPILQTFSLIQQTTTHAQAARESLVLNERVKCLKAATPPPEVIHDSVLKNLRRRSESAQTLFSGGGGEAGLPSRADREGGSNITRQTQEQLNGSEIRRNWRQTNEILRCMGSNRSRKTNYDGHNASIEEIYTNIISFFKKKSVRIQLFKLIHFSLNTFLQLSAQLKQTQASGRFQT
ncbi:MAG: hypothetical protein EZS28_030426 [Streblomastix strix]|uniref:Uncharacterized protein n=1 Tax=Streblomastix strix TaxID=222440 RepID=A0A5J4UUH8_9EUKA|nr:MAG: hypothetical protein EZS28_030426 [Streblomastix strix]